MLLSSLLLRGRSQTPGETPGDTGEEEEDEEEEEEEEGVRPALGGPA